MIITQNRTEDITKATNISFLLALFYFFAKYGVAGEEQGRMQQRHRCNIDYFRKVIVA